MPFEKAHWFNLLARGDPGNKGYTLGTHRLIAPSETLVHLRPLLPEMGITRIANVTGLDRIGLPVVMACRPNSRSVAVSQGKGFDLAAATASALMEAIETYHAERMDLPLKLASLTDLKGSHRPIDVNGLPRATAGRFHDHRPILWIQGHELLNDCTVWLPFESVHADYTLPQPAGSGCFLATTNGLASGNHMLEAICHGICEVIERDATERWYRLDKRTRDGTRLDPDSVDDGACREVLHRLQEASFTVAVWDTQSRIRVPSFYCLIRDEQRRHTHPGAGSGCHPSRSIALLRALLEAVQVRTTYIAGARDDLRRDEYLPATVERKLLNVQALIDGHAARRNFASTGGNEHATFAGDIHNLLVELVAKGLREVVVVDLTREPFGLPVVRVVIPGLEPFNEIGKERCKL
jgi:ribosomal protein S12 methylthiotransferase accessory factor